jgi:hypothetical protein
MFRLQEQNPTPVYMCVSSVVKRTGKVKYCKKFFYIFLISMTDQVILYKLVVNVGLLKNCMEILYLMVVYKMELVIEFIMFLWFSG